MFVFVLILVAAFAVMYFTIPGFKDKVDAAWAAFIAAASVGFAAVVEWWSSIVAMFG